MEDTIVVGEKELRSGVLDGSSILILNFPT